MKRFRLATRRARSCVLALTLALAPLASAQTPSDSKATGAVIRARSVIDNSPLTGGDRRFVAKAARLGMEEVRLSRLAAARASHPEVRRFAQALAERRERANTELIRLASSKSVVLSMDDDPRLARWSAKEASEFDREYLEEMIGAHEDAIDLLEERVEKAEDGEVAAYARRHLPALRQHLRQAEELLNTLEQPS